MNALYFHGEIGINENIVEECDPITEWKRLDVFLRKTLQKRQVSYIGIKYFEKELIPLVFFLILVTQVEFFNC